MTKRSRALALSFALILMALVFATNVPPCLAQTGTPTPSQPAATSASAPATQTSVYTLPPDKLAKSKALYDLRGTLRIVGTVWSFVVLIALLYLGVVARYRDWAEKLSKNLFVQALVVAPLFVLTLSILDLPLDAYQQSISLQYGLSVQGWGSWFGDFLKGQLILIIIATPALFLLIWFIRKSPRRWWFYFWLIAVPCIRLPGHDYPLS